MGAALASSRAAVLGRRRRLCAALRAWHADPTRFPLLSHSFLPWSERPGGPGPLALAAAAVVSWDMRRGLWLSPFQRGRRAPVWWSWLPHFGAAYGAPGQTPLSHPRAMRSCHWLGAGGDRATGVEVRFRRRYVQIRRSPTHRGPFGRCHLWLCGAGLSEPSPLPRTLTVSPL